MRARGAKGSEIAAASGFHVPCNEQLCKTAFLNKNTTLLNFKQKTPQRFFNTNRYISAFFLRCFWTRFAVCFFWASLRQWSEQYIVRPLAGNGFPQCLHRFAAEPCKAAFSSGSLGRTLSQKYRHMAFPQLAFPNITHAQSSGRQPYTGW